MYPRGQMQRFVWQMDTIKLPEVVFSACASRTHGSTSAPGLLTNSTDIKHMETRPKITISSRDSDRLERLLDSLGSDAFPGRLELETELGRADIVPPEDIPPTVVTMNSTVRFRVQDSSETFSLTLVYPRDMDASSGKISILAPVGGALLGLSQGDEIAWPNPGGGNLRVRIEEVEYQPERAGELHR